MTFDFDYGVFQMNTQGWTTIRELERQKEEIADLNRFIESLESRFAKSFFHQRQLEQHLADGVCALLNHGREIDVLTGKLA